MTVGHVDELSGEGRALLVAVSEVFLEFIGIVGSVIGFAGEFPVRGVDIKECIRTSGCENGFDFFFVITVGDLGESAEIVLERELVDDDEFATLVYNRDFATENIIIVPTGRIPGWATIPIGNLDEFCRQFYFFERVFFPSDYESDFIGSICLKREGKISAERTGYLGSERETGEGGITRFEANSRPGIREPDADIRSLGERLCRTWCIGCRSYFDGLYIYVGIFAIGESFGNRICESGTLDERVEIGSGTTRRPSIPVSGEIRHGKILDETVARRTLLVSDGCLVDIYPVFLSEIGDDIRKSVLLFCDDAVLHEIPHDTHSDGTFVIPDGVCSDNIIASGTTLIDSTALTDDVIVPDIAPTTHNGMVVIDPPNE